LAIFGANPMNFLQCIDLIVVRSESIITEVEAV
jgi:hypothetical protein